MIWTDRRMVMIEWKDACCDASWTSPGTKHSPAMCWTIGLIVHEDEEVTSVAGTIADSGDYNQIMNIPTNTIVNIEEIGRQCLPEKDSSSA
jgi:hypothetical protein